MIDDAYVLKNQFMIDRKINPQYASPSIIVEVSDSERRPDYKKWDRQPNIVAKRNARERTRVHTVNQAFVILKCHLPSLRSHTKRVSKLKILKAAINYIESLIDLLKCYPLIVVIIKNNNRSGSIILHGQRKTRATVGESNITFYSITNPADRSTITGNSFPYVKTFLDYPSYIYPPPPSSQPLVMGNHFIFPPGYSQ
uniref:BHLH domain-containing protein n=1 Tax=Heterorhabditis bacteriophora TaxID=37862 RepID=A0A1I7WUQ3_HETBA